MNKSIRSVVIPIHKEHRISRNKNQYQPHQQVRHTFGVGHEFLKCEKYVHGFPFY